MDKPAVIYIRNVPQDVAREFRIRAAMADMPYAAYLAWLLEHTPEPAASRQSQ